MSTLPDLVQGTKLDTAFVGDLTVHQHDDSDDESPQARPARRAEYWATEKLLACGGFGEVYLQRCVEGRRRVEWRVVKVLLKHKSASRKINYLTELEAIAKFSQRRYSKCFVKFIGWYETADALFITMEYFPLGDLQAHMSEAAPMPEKDVQEISYQILEGLNHMHEEDFAHRDIKPGNILIKSKPPVGTWWVKLSDFGISKRLGGHFEQNSTVQGTRFYMAPELFGVQSGGNIRINYKAADIWSLGEIMFRMLTGKPAFPSAMSMFGYLSMPEFFPFKILVDNGVGEEAIDLLQCVMKPAPESRPKAHEALGHAWLLPLRPPSPSPESGMVLPLLSNTNPIAALTRGPMPGIRQGARAWATEPSTDATSIFGTRLSKGSLTTTTHPTGRSRSAGPPSEPLDSEQRGYHMERRLSYEQAFDSDPEPSQSHKLEGPVLPGSDVARSKAPSALEDQVDGSSGQTALTPSRPAAFAGPRLIPPATGPVKPLNITALPFQNRTALQGLSATGIRHSQSADLQPDGEQARASRPPRLLQPMPSSRSEAKEWISSMIGKSGMKEDGFQDFAFMSDDQGYPIAVGHLPNRGSSRGKILVLALSPDGGGDGIPLRFAAGIECMATSASGDMSGNMAVALTIGWVEVFKLPNLHNSSPQLSLKARNVISLAFPRGKPRSLLILFKHKLWWWKISEGLAVVSSDTGKFPNTRMELTANGNRLGVLSGNMGVTVFQHDAEKDRWLRLTRIEFDTPIVCFGFERAGGERLVVVDFGGRVDTRSVEDGSRARREEIHYDVCQAMHRQFCGSFSPDGGLLAFVDRLRRFLVIIDRMRPQEEYMAAWRTELLSAGNTNPRVRFSENGKYVGVTGSAEYLNVWQLCRE